MTVTKDGREGNILEFAARDTVPYLLLVFGIASLLTSAFYSSYVLAFIGLGLTFWGTLFLYIKFTKYVKLELLNAASSSTLQNIERILATAGTDLIGIYLPPKNLEDYTASLVFIPSRPDQPLPTSVDTNPQRLQSQNPLGLFSRGLALSPPKRLIDLTSNPLFTPKTTDQPLPTTAKTNTTETESQNPTGLFITPPGLALSKLFEKHLGKPFTETKLADLHTLLPKLLEELEITKNTTVQTQWNTVIIEMKNHIFEALCEETRKLKRTHETVGCPLSSALACILAKATGKPVTIEKEETLPDETTRIQYTLLED